MSLCIEVGEVHGNPCALGLWMSTEISVYQFGNVQGHFCAFVFGMPMEISVHYSSARHWKPLYISIGDVHENLYALGLERLPRQRL